MITEWLYSIFANMSGWFAGLVPSVPAGVNPVGGIVSVLGPVSEGMTGLGAWIPWDVVNICVPITITLYLASLVLRAIKSFIPTISG